MPLQGNDLSNTWKRSNQFPARKWQSTYCEHYRDPTKRGRREEYWLKRSNARTARMLDEAELLRTTKGYHPPSYTLAFNPLPPTTSYTQKYEIIPQAATSKKTQRPKSAVVTSSNAPLRQTYAYHPAVNQQLVYPAVMQPNTGVYPVEYSYPTGASFNQVSSNNRGNYQSFPLYPVVAQPSQLGYPEQSTITQPTITQIPTGSSQTNVFNINLPPGYTAQPSLVRPQSAQNPRSVVTAPYGYAPAVKPRPTTMT